MSVYSDVANESYIDNVNDFSEGFKAIAEAMTDPRYITLAESNDKYYVKAESVEDYMNSAMIVDVNEAIDNIAKANNIDKKKINVVGVFEHVNIPVEESTVMLEYAVEDDAMTLKQAKKFYSQVLKTCKSKSETKEEIGDSIELLKECLKDMEKAKKDAENHKGGMQQAKYALKEFIPFNDIYRLFKRHDWTPAIINAISGLASAVITVAFPEAKIAKSIGTATKGISLYVRYFTYNSMLDKQIKNTKEAIEYLENKRKELDKKDKEEKK